MLQELLESLEVNLINAKKHPQDRFFSGAIDCLTGLLLFHMDSKTSVYCLSCPYKSLRNAIQAYRWEGKQKKILEKPLENLLKHFRESEGF
jgi:hypothetical protein